MEKIFSKPLIFILIAICFNACSGPLNQQNQEAGMLFVKTAKVESTNGYSRSFDGVFDFSESWKLSFKTGGGY